MSSKRKQKAQQRKAAEVEYQQPEEYVAPDPSTKITWPRHLAGCDDSKFVVVWPNNINSKKTIPNGRRISVEHACEDPIVQEMSEACQYLKLTHVIEPYKSLPRDLMAYPGRLRVELTDDIKSRKELMRKMAELIPTLTIRKQRDAKRAAALQQQAPGAQAAASTKKKGKKKGRRS